MYEVREIKDREKWDTFYASQDWTPFVQSSMYGMFYEKRGEKSWIIGVFRDGVLIGGGVVVSTTARRGSFLYVPYGPVLPIDDPVAFEKFFIYLKKLAKHEKVAFIRVSPFLDDVPEVQKIFSKCGAKAAPIHILAENTWLLNVAEDPETILKNMKKNHRNLIRRCEREGVTVKVGTDKKMLDELNVLLDETAKRHNFVRYPQSYIEKEFFTLAEQDAAKIFNTYLPDGTLHASAIIYMYGSMGVYRHSASRTEPKNLPTSYLIQWNVIQTLHKMGKKWYNFWGVAPKDASKSHPFYGITHFKKGFGGMQKDLLPAQDIPISPTYKITWAIETIRRMRRGF